MEWETAIKRKKTEGESYEQRYNYYVSIGMIDEHTSNFCSLRKSFYSIANTFDELIAAIKEYQKELIGILHQENTNPDKEGLLLTHENLGKYTKSYTHTVAQQLKEVDEKLEKVHFNFNNVEETFYW